MIQDNNINHFPVYSLALMLMLAQTVGLSVPHQGLFFFKLKL